MLCVVRRMLYDVDVRMEDGAKIDDRMPNRSVRNTKGWKERCGRDVNGRRDSNCVCWAAGKRIGRRATASCV